jgi:putative membrane protein
MRAGRRGAAAIHRLPRAGLAVLYLFSAIALVGYATFGRNPGLLAGLPGAAAVYPLAFGFFSQAQIWLAGIVLALLLTRDAGTRWLGAFAALYLISLGSELLGTTVGLPFGEYRYSEALGPRWFGHVPVVIPVSWFFMAVPAFALARLLRPARGAGRVLAGSLILLAWDLALDPAMSFATAYWVWAEPGAYYGMPWLNLFGWYVTGLALMAALAGVGADDWIDRLPVRWLAAYYGANLLLPVGMTAAAGMWGAVGATAAVLGLMGAAAALRGRRAESIPETAGVLA